MVELACVTALPIEYWEGQDDVTLATTIAFLERRSTRG